MESQFCPRFVTILTSCARVDAEKRSTAGEFEVNKPVDDQLDIHRIFSVPISLRGRQVI
jgi:hypothetical protein